MMMIVMARSLFTCGRAPPSMCVCERERARARARKFTPLTPLHKTHLCHVLFGVTDLGNLVIHVLKLRH